MKKAMDAVGYRRAARRAEAKSMKPSSAAKTRELMGIGVSFFTEIVGAGPSKNC